MATTDQEKRRGSTSGVPREARTAYLLKRLELAVRAEMDRMVKPFGATTLQYTALTVLQRRPGISSAQLARRSFVSPQAANVMVGALLKKGLIERSPDVRNRRVLGMTVTPAGDALVKACEEELDRIESRMMGSLSTRERRVLHETLDRCARALEEVTENAPREDR